MKAASNWFFAIVATVVFLLVFGLVGFIDSVATTRELTRGYNLCPKPAPGLTNSLVMVIETTADDRPTVTSCVRIAERQYTPRPGPTVQKMARQ